MIQKLENGNTLITLGEGTVFTGNVHVNGDDKPFGIYFTNEKGKSADAVIIQITSDKAVASYIMALLRLLEAWEDDKESQFTKIVESFKRVLEPMLPKNE